MSNALDYVKGEVLTLSWKQEGSWLPG